MSARLVVKLASTDVAPLPTVPLSNATILFRSIPFSVSLEGLGTVSPTSLRIDRGSYNRSTNTLTVNSGTLDYSAGIFGGTANLTNVTFQATEQGLVIDSTQGNICAFLVGCRQVQLVVPYTSTFTRAALLNLIEQVASRVGSQIRIGKARYFNLTPNYTTFVAGMYKFKSA